MVDVASVVRCNVHVCNTVYVYMYLARERVCSVGQQQACLADSTIANGYTLEILHVN